MNLVTPFTSVYPVMPASAGNLAPSVIAAASAEGFATDQDDAARAVAQSPESRPDNTATDQGRQADASPQSLDEAQLKELAELKARDREVRAHEAAHQAVGGQYAGAMAFTYQRGPDGAQYAVGGEVPIDVSAVAGDPQATIEKMRVVQAAAMAPAQPSAQDRAVAAQAMQIMLQAQAELAVADQGKMAVGQQASDAYRGVSAMGGVVSRSVTSVIA